MAKFQNIMFAMTLEPDIRDGAWGWGVEGPCSDSLIRFHRDGDVDVGLLKNPKPLCCYETVLHAMHDGWRVMGPPRAIGTGDNKEWEWWLTKNVKI